jgi:protein-S-isoprenylcysteine O-methyltransferase Ste14
MSPVLRTLIFTILVPGFWTVVIPFVVLPSGARPDFHGVNAAGWVFIVAGAALYFACAFWGFAMRGKGTPLPLDPPKNLVVEGPYTVVRNPMYWGVGSVIFGEAVVFHSRPLANALGVFVIGVILFVLGVEEPSLQKKFGAEYEQYCRRVPRWFPRFK